MKYCIDCETLLTNNNWWKSYAKICLNICITCAKKRGKNYQRKNRIKINKEKRKYYEKNKTAYFKKSQQKYKINQHIMKNLKINGCAICGYNECTAALDFHHANSKDKSFPLSINGLQHKDNCIVEEINKCVLLCANCHREIHVKERKK